METLMTYKEHRRPMRIPTIEEWTAPALPAAAYAGALACGAYLLTLESEWTKALGWFLVLGGLTGAVVLLALLRTYPWLEMVDIQEYEPVQGERRIPTTANGQTTQQPIRKGIFTQAEFVSMGRQAAETGRLTRSPHGFSGDRYQEAYGWLAGRGYVAHDGQGWAWTDAGCRWLEIAPPRANLAGVASGDDDDDHATEEI